MGAWFPPEVGQHKVEEGEGRVTVLVGVCLCVRACVCECARARVCECVGGGVLMGKGG
jgi:hypothetical protein